MNLYQIVREETTYLYKTVAYEVEAMSEDEALRKLDKEDYIGESVIKTDTSEFNVDVDDERKYTEVKLVKPNI